MQSFRNVLVATLVLFPAFVLALPPAEAQQQAASDAKQAITKAFRYYKTVSPSVSVPTVLEVPLSSEPSILPVFAVFNLTTSEFEPYYLKQSLSRITTGSRIDAPGAMGSPYAIRDANYETYLEFPVRDVLNSAEVTFTFDKPIMASSLSFTLDNYVVLPQTISITAVVSGRSYTVLAPTRLSRSSVSFPKTTSAVWHMTFGYVQPLRISEMNFDELSAGEVFSKGLRFLAQPEQSYQVYFDADRYVQSAKKEAGDLSTDKGVVVLKVSSATMNPEYAPVDSDGDSVPDLTDNCTSIANADQKDSDGNGLGDACEDYDRDGRVNAQDNCPEIPNRAQEDTDNDGIGDVCDTYEDRPTERMPWLPWVGIGLAGVVLLGLFIVVFKHKDVVPPPDSPVPPTV